MEFGRLLKLTFLNKTTFLLPAVIMIKEDIPDCKQMFPFSLAPHCNFSTPSPHPASNLFTRDTNQLWEAYSTILWVQRFPHAITSKHSFKKKQKKKHFLPEHTSSSFSLVLFFSNCSWKAFQWQLCRIQLKSASVAWKKIYKDK